MARKKSKLDELANSLAEAMRRTDERIVFAESCTGGLVAARLTQVPGISRWLCGSAVVYQIETKAAWLGIPEELLDDPGPVSEVVAAEMAARVLGGTPQASVAVSVTGHLGPGAPPELDGVVFVGTALRDEENESAEVNVAELRLPAPSAESSPAELRLARQIEVAQFVLQVALDVVERP